jgi:alpha-D-ribose 1-methylphosphonate 5-triphosphate synthase subunit PhnG
VERVARNLHALARKDAMAVVSAAPADDLRSLWETAALEASVEWLRPPETGLVTIRGRIGGGGAPFNVGEATVTRATVRTAGGFVGHGYALGRDKDKVRTAAILDALWQDEATRAAVEDRILRPLRGAAAEAAARQRMETAATKVDFFTMVRGED